MSLPKPWIDTPETKIWDVLKTIREQVPKNPNDASLGAWIVHAPWMAAIPGIGSPWEYHYCSLIHLRDIPGQEPSVIRFPGLRTNLSR